MELLNGQEVWVSLPPDPDPRERFAAEELSRYLFAILKLRLRQGEAPAGAPRFLIGGPSRNPAAGALLSQEEFSRLLTGPEGLMILIKGSTVLLAGSEGFDDCRRGTLYALYEFLEQYLGCAFGAYSGPEMNAGEIVPSLARAVLPEGRFIKAGAGRPYRAAIVQYGEAAGNPVHQLNLPFIDWLAKNRYNRILTWASVYESYKSQGLLPKIEKRGISLSVGHHESSRMWLPYFGNSYFPEHYAETHPEYYRLKADGSRFRPKNRDDHTGQWIYCSRNKGCIAQVAENLCRWIGENPLVDTIAFWPNDGIAEQCGCKACAPYSKVENYAYFQNEVAKRVSAKYPRIKIDMLVYVDLWEYPQGMALSPNLRIDEAAWGKEQRKCGKPDGSCLMGTEFEENLLRWKAAGAETVFYDYYMGVYGNRQRVIPMADELQSIWQGFARLGIAGAGTQIECFNLWNHLVNLYTFGRTAYDNALSLENNLSALCRLFGEGGKEVAQAVRLMEEALDGQEIIGFAGKYMIEHVDKAAVYRLFDQALAAAKGKRERNNIRLMRMAFRYSEVETADPANARRKVSSRFQDYDDPTGELAFLAGHFDSFLRNDPGYAIAFPVTNTDVKGFRPDGWHAFE